MEPLVKNLFHANKFLTGELDEKIISIWLASHACISFVHAAATFIRTDTLS